MKGPKDVEYLEVAKIDANKTSYTAKKLKPGEKYDFRVKSKNKAGLSETGAELNEPVILKEEKGEHHYAVLSWLWEISFLSHALE